MITALEARDQELTLNLVCTKVIGEYKRRLERNIVSVEKGLVNRNSVETDIEPIPEENVVPDIQEPVVPDIQEPRKSARVNNGVPPTCLIAFDRNNGSG